MCLAQGHNTVTPVKLKSQPLSLKSSTLPLSHCASQSVPLLFGLFVLYVPSTIFQLNRDGSTWVEPVLSKDIMYVSCSRTQRSDAGETQIATPGSRVKHSTTEPLFSAVCTFVVWMQRSQLTWISFFHSKHWSHLRT